MKILKNNIIAFSLNLGLGLKYKRKYLAKNKRI